MVILEIVCTRRVLAWAYVLLAMSSVAVGLYICAIAPATAAAAVVHCSREEAAALPLPTRV